MFGVVESVLFIHALEEFSAAHSRGMYIYDGRPGGIICNRSIVGCHSGVYVVVVV